MQNLRRPYIGNRPHGKYLTSRSMDACQERVVMEETDERKGRDVRAIRWLIDSTAVNAEMEPLVLAISGSFNTEWGRDVWRVVSSQARDTSESLSGPLPTSSQVFLVPHPPHPLGAAGDTISRCVRYLFETCNSHSHFENEEARRRRMRACVEATASLVCCIDFRLQGFGEVGKLVSEIGHIEKVNELRTNRSYSSFTVHWTCLALMEIQQKLSSNRVQGLAGYAVSVLARLQSESRSLDETAYKSAQRIDECLRTAWERVEDLRRAFEPWDQKKTKDQVEGILRRHESQILELERIKLEADDMGDIDWRISLLQGATEDVTHRLIRQLPGIPFSALKRSGPLLINEIFNFPLMYSTPITPQLVFPAQQIRALSALSLKSREVLEGRSTEDGDVLESLESIDKLRVPLRRTHDLTTRQLWRLQDLRDGGGLGFTTELFFLSLRQLLSVSSPQESNRVFYTGTFRNIVSHWRESKESLGTQNILLNIVCDLVIQGRGVFSDFSYPEYITTMLLEVAGNMLRAHVGPESHINDAMRAIECVEPKKLFGLWTWLSQGLSGARQSRLFPNPGATGSRGIIPTTLQIPYARRMRLVSLL